MPKPQRKPEQVEAFKEEILKYASEIIVKEGFRGFSMRRLGSSLGVSAKTIYNYFSNKDEIYLLILTRGSDQLFDKCLEAFDSAKDPVARLESMIDAYLDFGLDNSNMYNLMFTWHVPRFNDYIGTPLESAARVQLESAMRVADLFISAMQKASDPGTMDDSLVRSLLVNFWSQLHGFIAGVNNDLFNYIMDNPVSMRKMVLDQAMNGLMKEISFKATSKIAPLAQ